MPSEQLIVYFEALTVMSMRMIFACLPKPLVSTGNHTPARCVRHTALVLVAVLIAVLIPVVTHPQIAYAASLPTLDATSTGPSGTSATSYSWSHTTTTLNNRLLLVTLASYDSDATATPSSITYAGVSLTQLADTGEGYNDCNYQCDLQVWFLINPATGTNTITVNYATSSSNRAFGAVTFYNVAQTSPFPSTTAPYGSVVTTQPGSSQSASASITVGSTNTTQLVYDSFLCGESPCPTWAPSSGQTQIWPSSFSSFWNTTNGSTKPGSSGSTALSWSATGGSSYWADIAVPLNPPPTPLTSVSLSVSNNQIGAASVYTWEFTTATTGTIASVTLTVPSGTSGATLTVQQVYGLSPGTAALSGTTVTYTITTPASVSAGTPVYLEISGLTNTSTVTSNFQSAITTQVSGPATLDGPTSAPAVSFTSNNTHLTLIIAEVAAVTAPSVASYTLAGDPLVNHDLTFQDAGFKVITNAGSGWTLAAEDSTNGLYDSVTTKAIAPVSSGVASAVATFPTSTDADAFGYSVTTVTPDASCSSGCGTATNNLSSKWAGFKHGSFDSAFLSSNGPTGDNGVDFTLSYQIALSYAVADAPGPSNNHYADTITYAFNGSY